MQKQRKSDGGAPGAPAPASGDALQKAKEVVIAAQETQKRIDEALAQPQKRTMILRLCTTCHVIGCREGPEFADYEIDMDDAHYGEEPTIIRRMNDREYAGHKFGPFSPKNPTGRT